MTITGQESDTAITEGAPAAKRAPMSAHRRTALVAGGLYLLTFVTSIPSLGLYAGLDDPDFIAGAGSDAPVIWGAFLYVLCALAGAGTAIALYPVTKRYSQTAAIGFVASRVLESSLILVGVVSVLSVVTLRHDLAGAGTDAASLVTAGQSLVAVNHVSFFIGQSLMAGVNALLLGYVMYRSGLVPRMIPLLGLIGAPLLLASSTATIFGLYDQISPIALFTGLPVAVWEFSLGTYLVVKGFKPAPVAAGVTADSTEGAPSAYREVTV